MRELSRDTLIGRPWLELITESDRTLAAACLEAASTTPGVAQKIDIHLNILSNQEPVPVSCWICGTSEDENLRLACLDLRSESNLRQQLVNAQ